MGKGAHQVSVEDLISRLSAEVKRLQEHAVEKHPALPPQLAIPELPLNEQFARYEQLLSNMLSKAQPTSWFGRFLTRFFPEQISHNLLTVETLTTLFETYRALAYECMRAKWDLSVFRQQLDEGIAADLQRDFVVFQNDNETRSKWLEEMVRGFTREQSDERSRIEWRVSEQHSRMESLIAEQHSRMESLIAEQHSRIESLVSEERACVDKLMKEHVADHDRLEKIARTFDELMEKQAKRHELVEIEFKLNRSLIARRLGNPSDAASIPAPANGHDGDLDAFYVEFENRFRGSREEVTRRLRIWLPVLEKALRAGETGIIDIGCGRGEWLELVREQGHAGIGIDMNPRMVELCVSFGLDARVDDALSFLQDLPDATQSLVSGFHIIEHLPFRLRRQILGEVFRVLRPGGLAIFETPNPSNVLVGSHTFYTDYTHLQPLPPAATQFLFETLGFKEVEIREVNPMTDMAKLPGTGEPLRDRFNKYFYGPQDYAVLAWKPGAA